jgi:hypothetical protein
MRRSIVVVGVWIGLCGASVVAAGGALPPDVRPNFWAASAVQEALRNGILSARADGKFHGEAKVTRTEAVIALARLAQALESGKWQASASQPVTGKTIPILEQGSWKQQPVSRYVLAAALARFGDYVMNGLHRAPADSQDRAKSVILPPKATVTVPSTNPAYASLTYLANNHMIWPGSPLLKPDDQPVRGAELSRALGEMTAGLNDLVTDMGRDEEGNTPDKSFHKK